MMRIGEIPLSISPWLIPVVALAAYVGQGLLFCTWMLVILAHELAHVAAARLLGAAVARVRVQPFGCEAELESPMCLAPGTEALIALAGPACNLLAAMAVALCHQLWGLDPEWVRRLLTANLALCGLNLLPALPLDGGRILRALLVPRLGYARATRRVAGAGIAAALGLLALFVLAAARGSINVTLLGFSLFLGLTALRQRREAAAFLPARWDARRLDAFVPVRNVAVSDATTLGEVFRRWNPRRYHLLTVVDEQGRALGTLDEQTPWEGINRFDPGTPVGRLAKFR